MAKGWESKSVESQIEESEKKRPGKPKGQMTPAQLDVHRRREVLLLARARVQGDLRSSQNQRYQDQLNRALADIETQLSALEEVI
jgi:hypothetical protein